MEENKIKSKFNFAEYYKNNPEFQKRHKEKLAQPVVCTCGKTIRKSYLTTHMKNKAHEKYLAIQNDLKQKKDDDYDKLREEIKELKVLLTQK